MGVDIKKLLGKKIKFFRKRMGLTQNDLMKLLGYTSSGMLSQIESGERGMDLTKIVKAAEVFGVDITALVSDYDFKDEQLSIILGVFATLKRGNNDTGYKRLKNMFA